MIYSQPKLKIVQQDNKVEGELLNLDALYRQYSGYVASILHKLLGRPDEVDDLIQDVFIDAQNGLKKLRDPNAASAWLAQIAVRRAYKHLKKRRIKRMFSLDEVPAYKNIADHHATPEQVAQIAAVYRILDEITPKKRIAWILRNVEGEPINSVIEKVGGSRATLHRWITQVQGIIEKELSDE